ncbi:hypothetical protein R6Q59_023551 [Mikania micrantha]
MVDLISLDKNAEMILGEWNIKNDLVLNYFRINISTQGSCLDTFLNGIGSCLDTFSYPDGNLFQPKRHCLNGSMVPQDSTKWEVLGSNPSCSEKGEAGSRTRAEGNRVPNSKFQFKLQATSISSSSSNLLQQSVNQRRGP